METTALEQHPAIAPGRVALVTGAASGIGFAAATAFAQLGMKVCLVDRDAEALSRSAADVAGISGQPGHTLGLVADVGRREEVERLQREVYGAFGEVAVMMNNAGIEGSGGGLFGSPERWRAILETNLFGVIHGIQVFAPAMIAQGTPCAIVSTGSKQGITTPPGNTAYNASKTAVKVVTEALAHELRGRAGCRVSAHLLIPGFVYTGFTRARGFSEKPAGAWTPAEVVAFLLPALARGDFYILCPDHETAREVDEKRIRWAAEDIVLNRPALSRWHPDFQDAFARYMAGERD